MIRLAGVLAWVVVGTLAGTSSGFAAEWPRNGGFEAGAGRPAEWHIEPEAAEKGGIRVTDKMASAGRYALELTPNARNTPSQKPLGAGQAIPAAPFRGKTVRVTADMAAEGGARAVVGLHVLGSSEYVHLRRSDAGPMRRFEGTLRVPDKSSIETLILFAVAEGTEGAVWFDEIAVTAEGAEAAPPPAPAPPLRPPPRADGGAADALAATVTVYPDQVLRRIPRTLFGTNVEWFRNANGLWNPAADSLDARIVDLSRDMGISLVRFPGGAWSDFYFWRDGVGPRARRPATPHYPGGEEKNRHLFGTDEALDFARRIGARLLITVNAGTGTPELAADWVRYVNGEGGKAPRVDRVDLWEVGNELYMKGDWSKASLSPADYARKFIAFAQAMRAADPGIEIGAIGLENYGRYRFNDYRDWNDTVLAAAGEEMDFLAVHNAYAPVLVDSSGVSPAEAYEAMLAAPVLIARNLATTADQIRRRAPKRADAIALAVTEWGPFFAVDPKSPFIDHVKTLGSALFVASTLKAFIEQPRTTIANFFKLSEPGFMGWLGMRGNRFVATAPAYALQMFTRHFGDALVRSETQSPGFDSRAIGVVEAVRNVPYLDVVASRGEDGRLYLLAVNKSLDRPVLADIRLTGGAGVTDAVAWALTGSAPDANTGTELPRVPGLRWGEQVSFPHGGRFAQGGPEEIRFGSAAVDLRGTSFAYAFPPHSVTSLELRID